MAKGNVGNLLQHWVFCEVLTFVNGCLDQNAKAKLLYLDTHAMAPLSSVTPTDKRFCDVRKRLGDFPRQPNPSQADPSAYERAWRAATDTDTGYPSSALLASHLLTHSATFVVADRDAKIVEQINGHSFCNGHAVAACNRDWRKMPWAEVIATEQPSILLVQMDPNKISPGHEIDPGSAFVS